MKHQGPRRWFLSYCRQAPIGNLERKVSQFQTLAFVLEILQMIPYSILEILSYI